MGICRTKDHLSIVALPQQKCYWTKALPHLKGYWTGVHVQAYSAAYLS